MPILLLDESDPRKSNLRRSLGWVAAGTLTAAAVVFLATRVGDDAQGAATGAPTAADATVSSSTAAAVPSASASAQASASASAAIPEVVEQPLARPPQRARPVGRKPKRSIYSME